MHIRTLCFTPSLQYRVRPNVIVHLISIRREVGANDRSYMINQSPRRHPVKLVAIDVTSVSTGHGDGR